LLIKIEAFLLALSRFHLPVKQYKDHVATIKMYTDQKVQANDIDCGQIKF